MRVDEDVQKFWDMQRNERSEEEPCTYQCHYCGDMFALLDLRACRMGLVCYKCESEKTADPNDPHDFID